MRVTKLFDMPPMEEVRAAPVRHFCWTHAHYEEHLYLVGWRQRQGIPVRDEIIHRHRLSEPCNAECVLLQVDLEPLPEPEPQEEVAS